ncbi:hypothetical protein EIP91_003060 [Steccherinum ochraceum]|uniref:Methyltransferase domain-containing protein n=1 Tax=Steccherinum ochraceum TaxID=92696 RepID=A0A4R0RJG3_9APHY|nr:hypothetical protein EIP91_003060 [Steccherinum ochraceum]
MSVVREIRPEAASVPSLDDGVVPLQLTEEETTFLKTAITKDENEMWKRVEDVRRRAYEKYPYPCLRGFYHIHFEMMRTSVYREILEAGRSGNTTFLEIGCCMGSDVRRLAFDGYPAANIIGTDLRQEFIDLGLELYRDRDTCKTRFFADDIFTVSPKTVDARPTEFSTATKLVQLKGQVSHLFLGALFHLYDEQTQYAIALAVATLLKHEKGSIIFGWHQGQDKEGAVDDEYLRGRFAHSPASWTEMWKRVFAQLESAAFADSRVVVDVVLKDGLPPEVYKSAPMMLYWNVKIV